MTLGPPLPHFRIPSHRLGELRIDVEPSTTDHDESLASVCERIHTRGDQLHGLPTFGLLDPHLKVRLREADGDLCAYVEDLQRRCLAGFSVFNRLVEVDRRADRHLRSPHSHCMAQYQRRGIATAVYEWALGTGICHVTGAHQSAGAHALWRNLARRYESGFAEIRNKKLTYLGRDIETGDLDRVETRMFLLPAKCSLTQFSTAVGMKNSPP